MTDQKSVYLDYAATTPADDRVVECMLPFFTQKFGNPSSIHGYGRAVKGAVEKTRASISEFLNCLESELIFAGSGTESDNLAIRGVLGSSGKRHIISARTEHSAVFNTCCELEAVGFEVTYVPVNRDGQVDPTAVEDAIREDTALISLMYVNNETGSLNRIMEIGNIARRFGVPFHTDAVQAFGKIPLDLAELPVDLMSASGHKIYGPKGIGLLFVRKGTSLNPIMWGGGQEKKLRPGTENTAAIAGLGKAVEICREVLDQEYRHAAALKSRLLTGLKDVFPGFTVNGRIDASIPHIVNVFLPDQEGDILLPRLDLMGIAVSSGSACSSGSAKPSRVLSNMGFDDARCVSSVRFSFGRDTSEHDIDRAVAALAEAAELTSAYPG